MKQDILRQKYTANVFSVTNLHYLRIPKPTGWLACERAKRKLAFYLGCVKISLASSVC